MQAKTIKPLFRYLLWLLIFLGGVPWVRADEQGLSLEEVAGTEAAKLYISKEFVRSLEEFQKLQDQYPESTLIKRYIAKLYDILRDREKAIAKLKEILSINRNDFIARQMLGDIYMKEGDLSLARQAYRYNFENDRGEYHAYAEKRLNEIQTVEFLSAEKSKEQDRISLDALIQSEAAKAFSKGRFKEALEEFSAISEKYPKDVLVRRLQGIALLRLERFKEAIDTFRGALKQDPDNAAVHYYLGQAYLEKGDYKKAREKFRWVIENDETQYKEQAKRALFGTLRRAEQLKRRWSLRVTTAYEYDTNATYKSNDKNFTRAGDQNSGRYKTLVFGTYDFFKRKKFSMTADAFYLQNISNDFPRLNTYTYGGGVSGLYGFTVFNKPVYINAREGITHTFLRNRSFLLTNSILSRIITQLHPKIRTMLSYRFDINSFDDRGLVPPLTDRDGMAHTATVSNTFYFNRNRTFFLTADYFFERQTTDGDNFNRNVHGTEWRLHFPLIFKFEGDLNLEYKNAEYPNYGFTPPKRNDDIFTLTSELSYPINDLLSLTGYYIFEDSQDPNNLFEYTKHIFGIEAALQY